MDLFLGWVGVRGPLPTYALCRVQPKPLYSKDRACCTRGCFVIGELVVARAGILFFTNFMKLVKVIGGLFF